MKSWTRREVLAASTLGAATLAARRGNAETQSEKAEKPKASRAPASESIVLGFIGVGGMGTGLLNIFKGFPDVRVAAVCDVYEPHARRAQSAAEGKPDVEHDFRKVLDRKDIDAVVIATPDHWHAIPTILAYNYLASRVGEVQFQMEKASALVANWRERVAKHG